MGSRSHSVWLGAHLTRATRWEPAPLETLCVTVDGGSSVVLLATGECTEPPRTRGFYLGRALVGALVPSSRAWRASCRLRPGVIEAPVRPSRRRFPREGVVNEHRTSVDQLIAGVLRRATSGTR
jgi:hypothetical protein